MLKGIHIVFILLLVAFQLNAQVDSLYTPRDTTKKEEVRKMKFAESSLESKLIFGAQDSQRYDHRNKAMHLKGNAYVKYEDKELYSDYIILEMETNIAEARQIKGIPNSQKPKFIDAGKEYRYNRLKYNFETEKGLVIESIAQEGEFMIHGQRTKYEKTNSSDSLSGATIYNKNATITTCTADHPHFGIRAKKMKLITDKLAVFGPSNLELGGIPTPIVIPFGFYPLTQGNSSGFIFPQNYEFNSRQLGFGLLGFGWYFPINDYVHVRLTADLYTRGTYAIYANTTYKKKYKYSGSFRLNYNDRRVDGVRQVLLDGELVEQATVISDKGFSISFEHKQDPKAHPFIDVGGRINMVSNNNQNRNYNDAQSVLQTSYNSNFYYRHAMPGSPFSFNMGLNHNQNTRSGVVNITLPDIQLNMNTIYPFERKNRGGNDQAWYEKISFDYDLKMKSFVQTTDSTLFTREMYDDIKTGMNHEINTGFSTRVFKYFNFVPRANYEETWVLNSIEKEITDNYDSSADTLITNTQTGFGSFRNYSAGVSLNTQIFGTAEFKKGWLRGIRHTMKPEVGYSYAPDTRSVYRDTLYYSDLERSPVIYTRFDNGPFNTPSFTDLQSQMRFRLQNIVEIKYFSKKDSTTKKMKLFDNITINGNYNFAKDTLQWSRIDVGSTSRFFKGVTTIMTKWSFDPYIEENNRSINKTTWAEEGKLVRLESGQIRWSNRLTFKKIRDLFKKDKSDDPPEEDESPDEKAGSEDFLTGPQEVERVQQNKSVKQLSFGDILDKISLDHNMLYVFTAEDGQVSSQMRTHAISLSGSIPLTENWTINIGNLGYDFVNKGLSYTAISFSRKLHCWDMYFSWFPNRDSYSFSIGVSSNALSFLKYNYGQNNVDGLLNRF